MAKLTQRQVALLWIAEGGSPHKADEWSAVIMGESGGDTQAHEGGDPNSCCHGLAQLNVDVGNASMRCALDPVCATRKSIRLSHNGRDFSPWGAYTNGSYSQYLGGSGIGAKGVGRHTAKSQLKTQLVDLHLGAPFVGPHLDIPLPGPDVNPLAPSEGLLKGGVGKWLGGAANEVLETDTNFLGLGDLYRSIKSIAAFFVGLGELFLTPAGWLRLGKLGGGAIMFFWGLRIFIRNSTGADPVKTGKSVVGKAVDAAALAATVK